MRLLEVVVTQEFYIFLLGAFGFPFFVRMYRQIRKCNENIFGAVCVILAYVFITYIKG